MSLACRLVDPLVEDEFELVSETALIGVGVSAVRAAGSHVTFVPGLLVIEVPVEHFCLELRVGIHVSDDGGSDGRGDELKRIGHVRSFRPWKRGNRI